MPCFYVAIQINVFYSVVVFLASHFFSTSYHGHVAYHIYIIPEKLICKIWYLGPSVVPDTVNATCFFSFCCIPPTTVAISLRIHLYSPVVTFIAAGLNYAQTFKFWRARSIFKPRKLNRCTKFTNPIITIATYYLLINISCM